MRKSLVVPLLVLAPAVLALAPSAAAEECSLALVLTSASPPAFTKNSMHPIRMVLEAVGGACPIEAHEMRLDGKTVPARLESEGATHVLAYEPTEDERYEIGPHTIEFSLAEACCNALGDATRAEYTYVFHLN